ncbi:RNA polymerase sigma-70 factor [Maribacter sp.]|uniref:RNA polymerase sigma factor n=1 Tax=Maribacter sp. TaxID=1897614 RepID=UPI0025BD76B5|nr:RNA polymerase sigma-70 factor [Maribacter sp.]
MIENFSNNSNLILYLKKGNENAYAYLIDTYNHKLCLYANSLMNDVSISEDIVQNVFIKVWERRDNLKTNLSIKSYLYKSVYNLSINEYKRNQSVTALEKKYIEELDRIIEDKDDDALEKLIGLVKEAIHELPPKCKEIFLLSKKEGLTNIEISEYLNISKNTIERQINIAFSKIRENVGGKTNIILFLLFGFCQNLKVK